MLDDRKKKIDEGFRYSEKMQAEFEKSEKKRADIIEKGRIEAQKIVAEARKAAKKIEDGTVEKAQKQASDIIKKAQIESEVMKKELIKETNQKAVTLAESIVRKVLKDSLDETSHIKIIDRKLREAGKKLK